MLNLQQKYITEKRPKAPPLLHKQNYPLDPHCKNLLNNSTHAIQNAFHGGGAYTNKPAHGKMCMIKINFLTWLVIKDNIESLYFYLTLYTLLNP